MIGFEREISSLNDNEKLLTEILKINIKE